MTLPNITGSTEQPQTPTVSTVGYQPEPEFHNYKGWQVPHEQWVKYWNATIDPISNKPYQFRQSEIEHYNRRLHERYDPYYSHDIETIRTAQYRDAKGLPNTQLPIPEYPWIDPQIDIVRWAAQDLYAAEQKFGPMYSIWQSNMDGSAAPPDYAEYAQFPLAQIPYFKMGYHPNYWDDPRRVAKWYDAIQTLPPNQIPDWIDPTKVTAAYNYMKAKNPGKPWTDWHFPHVDDPVRGMLSQMDTPPVEALLPSEYIYAMREQEEMPPADLEPPENAPWFVKGAHYLFGGGSPLGTVLGSSAIGAAGALAGGTLLGVLTGGVGLAALLPAMAGGALLGGGLGSAQAWAQTTLQKQAAAGATQEELEGSPAMTVLNFMMPVMMLFNSFYEFAMKRPVGMALQVGASIAEPERYGTINELLAHLPEAWQASYATSFAAPIEVLEPLEWISSAAGEKTVGANKVWSIYDDKPVPLQQLIGVDGELLKQNAGWTEALVWGRRQIAAGAPSEMVQAMLAQRYGLSGQMRELVGGVLLDPGWHAWPRNVTKGMGLVGSVMGNDALTAAAARALELGGSKGPITTLRLYSLGLRTETPIEIVAAGNILTRWLGGVDRVGSVRVTPEEAVAVAQIRSIVGGRVELPEAGAPVTIITTSGEAVVRPAYSPEGINPRAKSLLSLFGFKLVEMDARTAEVHPAPALVNVETKTIYVKPGTDAGTVNTLIGHEVGHYVGLQRGGQRHFAQNASDGALQELLRAGEIISRPEGVEAEPLSQQQLSEWRQNLLLEEGALFEPGGIAGETYAEALGKYLSDPEGFRREFPELARAFEESMQGAAIDLTPEDVSKRMVNDWLKGPEERVRIRRDHPEIAKRLDKLYPQGVKPGTKVADAQVRHLAPRSGLLNHLFGLTPRSRAMTVLGITADIMKSIVDNDELVTPQMVAKVLKDLRDTPILVAEDMSLRFIGATEGSYLIHVLKDFDFTKLDQMLQSWSSQETPRNMLLQLSRVTGDHPTKILEKIADPEMRRAFMEAIELKITRGVEAGDPAAMALKELLDAGFLSDQTLSQMFKLFVTENAPWHPDMWKAQLHDAWMDHVGEWTINKLGVKVEPLVWRLVKVSKAVHSLLLLDVNPSYAINNFVNNMGTMIVDGSFRMKSMKDALAWWNEFGAFPYKLRQAYGGPSELGIEYQGYHVELNKQAASELNLTGLRIKTESDATIKIADAASGKGGTRVAYDWISKIRQKTGIASRASAKIEEWSSVQATTKGTQQFWSRGWRRKVGFRGLPGHIEEALGPELTNVVYGIVEGNVSMTKVVDGLTKGLTLQRTLESTITDVARSLGMNPQDVADIMTTTGAKDFLEPLLANAKSPQEVRDAFAAMRHHTINHLDDLQVGENVTRIMNTAAQIETGDWTGFLNTWNEMQTQFDEWWTGHILRMNVEMEGVRQAETREAANQAATTAMLQSNQEAARMQRIELATIQGIEEGLRRIGVDFPQGYTDRLRQQQTSNKDFFAFRDGEWRDFWGKTASGELEFRSKAWKDEYVRISQAIEQRYGQIQAERYELQAEMDAGVVEMLAATSPELADRIGVMLGELREHRLTMALAEADVRRLQTSFRIRGNLTGKAAARQIRRHFAEHTDFVRAIEPWLTSLEGLEKIDSYELNSRLYQEYTQNMKIPAIAKETMIRNRGLQEAYRTAEPTAQQPSFSDVVRAANETIPQSEADLEQPQIRVPVERDVPVSASRVQELVDAGRTLEEAQRIATNEAAAMVNQPVMHETATSALGSLRALAYEAGIETATREGAPADAHLINWINSGIGLDLAEGGVPIRFLDELAPDQMEAVKVKLEEQKAWNDSLRAQAADAGMTYEAVKFLDDKKGSLPYIRKVAEQNGLHENLGKQMDKQEIHDWLLAKRSGRPYQYSEQNYMTPKQFEEDVLKGSMRLPDEQAAAVMVLQAQRARAAGQSLDDFLALRYSNLDADAQTAFYQRMGVDHPWVKAALNYYGRTDNPRSGLYLLRDGTLLDGSGRSQGSQAREGQRLIDHREIGSAAYAYNEETGKYTRVPGTEGMQGGTEGMFDFMYNTGSIRWQMFGTRATGQVLNIDVTGPISQDQLSTIVRNAIGKERFQITAWPRERGVGEGQAPWGMDEQPLWVRSTQDTSAEAVSELLSELERVHPITRYQTPEMVLQNPRFVEWFGQSKVTDVASGKPMLVYHGTAYPGFSVFDMSESNPDNLFGHGFYFTNDAEVAGGMYRTENKVTMYNSEEAALENTPSHLQHLVHATKNDDGTLAWRGYRPEVKIVQQGYVHKGGAMEIENPVMRSQMEDAILADSWAREVIEGTGRGEGYLSPSERQAILNMIGAFGEHGYLEPLLMLEGQPYNIPVRSILERAGLLNQGAVYPVYLRIENPLMIDSIPAPEDAMAFAKGLKGFALATRGDQALRLSGLGATLDEIGAYMEAWIIQGGQEQSYASLFQELRSELYGRVGDPESFLLEYMKHLGYDGIEYAGGLRTNAMRGHRSFVAFDSTQIKSAHNMGDFNPRVTDIRYQEGPPEPAPMFYSLMRRVIAEKMPPKMPADDAIAWLQKQGIKADEFHATGLLGYLEALGKEMVSKAEVDYYLDQNNDFLSIKPIIQPSKVWLPGEPATLRGGLPALGIRGGRGGEIEWKHPMEPMISGDRPESFGAHAEIPQMVEADDVWVPDLPTPEVRIFYTPRTNGDMYWATDSWNRNTYHEHPLYEVTIEDVMQGRFPEPPEFHGDPNKDYFKENNQHLILVHPTADGTPEVVQAADGTWRIKNQAKFKPFHIQDDHALLYDFDRAVADHKDWMPTQIIRSDATGPFNATGEEYNVFYQHHQDTPRRHVGRFDNLEDAYFHAETGQRLETLDSQYETYTLKGGSHYEEHLLTLPSEQQQYENRVQRTTEWLLAQPELGKFAKDQIESVARNFPVSTGDKEKAVSAIDFLKRNGIDTEYMQRVFYGTQEMENFNSGHFDPENIIVHLRTKHRMDGDLQEMFFIEEIQSDLHQAGRKRGYQTQMDPGEITQRREDIAEMGRGLEAEGIASRWVDNPVADQVARFAPTEHFFGGDPINWYPYIFDIHRPTSGELVDFPLHRARDHMGREYFSTPSPTLARHFMEVVKTGNLWKDYPTGMFLERVVVSAPADGSAGDFGWIPDAVEDAPFIKTMVDSDPETGTPIEIEYYETSLRVARRMSDGQRYWEMNTNQMLKMADYELAVRELHNLETAARAGGIPDLPWKKDWHEMAFRYALRKAAENGQTRIGWTTGKQQMERYSSGVIADAIDYRHRQAGGVAVKVWRRGDAVGSYNWDDAAMAAQYVGDDIAARMFAEGHDLDYTYRLSGDDIVVGSKGMRMFYDELLPRYANKYGKKYGIQVETGTIDVGQEFESPIYFVMSSTGVPLRAYTTRQGAEAYLKIVQDNAIHSIRNAEITYGDTGNGKDIIREQEWIRDQTRIVETRADPREMGFDIKQVKEITTASDDVYEMIMVYRNEQFVLDDGQLWNGINYPKALSRLQALQTRYEPVHSMEIPTELRDMVLYDGQRLYQMPFEQGLHQRKQAALEALRGKKIDVERIMLTREVPEGLNPDTRAQILELIVANDSIRYFETTGQTYTFGHQVEWFRKQFGMDFQVELREVDANMPTLGEGTQRAFELYEPRTGLVLARFTDQDIAARAKQFINAGDQAMMPFQKGEAPGFQPKGEFARLSDGKAIIKGLTNPDFSTGIHEIAHEMRINLDYADNEIAVRWYRDTHKGEVDLLDDGTIIGRDVEDFEEKFARGFEQYITEGVSPIPALTELFRKMMDWMLEVYHTIAGTQIDVKINDEMRALFARQIGGDEAAAYYNQVRPAPETPPAAPQDVSIHGQHHAQEPTLDYRLWDLNEQVKALDVVEDAAVMQQRLDALRAEAADIGEPASDILLKIEDKASLMEAAIRSTERADQRYYGQAVAAHGPDPNEKFQMQYRVIELDDLIPSHDLDGNRTRGYPRQLQPRARDRAASQQLIAERAAKLSPEALGRSNRIDDGAPIIGADALVESGNGRVLSMLQARRDYPEAWQSYKTWLKGEVNRVGIPDEILESMENPVLVRERLAPDGESLTDRVAFVEKANGNITQSMSHMELAASDAKNISDDILANFVVSENQSLDEAIRGAGNRSLVRSFTAALPPNEQGMMVDAQGALSRPGLQRIKAALLGKVFNAAESDVGNRMVNLHIEAVDVNVKRVTAGIEAALPEIAKAEALIQSGRRPQELSIAQDLAAATLALRNMRENGIHINDILGQQDMFGGGLTDFQKILLEFLVVPQKQAEGSRNASYVSTKKIRETLQEYGARVVALPEIGQTGLFGEVEYPSKQALFEIAVQGGARPLWQLPPEAAPGALEQVPEPLHMASAQAEAWENVQPVMQQIEQRMADPSAFRREYSRAEMNSRLTPEMQQEFDAWLRGVSGDMTSTKHTAIRWGEAVRDWALLDYNNRMGIDSYMEAIMPYYFWPSRTVLRWALRSFDRPGLIANYYRLLSIQGMYQPPEGYPSRLKGKVKIPMPFLPDWMGDGLYVDPLRSWFPPAMFAGQFTQIANQQARLQRTTAYLIQQKVAQGQISQQDAQRALQSHAGPIWDAALEQAQAEDSSDLRGVMDYLGVLSSFSIPLSWGKEIVRGTPENIRELPTTRTIRTATAALPQVFGVGGINIEKPIRSALDLPMVDKYEDYRIRRMISNQVAEGNVDPAAAQLAFVQGEGPVWDEARVMLDQARFRGSFANPLYWIGFPADTYPEGEQKQRQLQGEFSNAMDAYYKGDDTAMRRMLEKYPEYESRLNLNKDPNEILRYMLVDEVWMRYMDLGSADKELVRLQMGEDFQRMFLDKPPKGEKRNYEAIPIQTLANWAQMLNAALPPLPERSNGVDLPQLETISQEQQVKILPPEISVVIDTYRDERKAKHPNWYATQQLFFQQPPEARQGWLRNTDQGQELLAYWEWDDAVKKANPIIGLYSEQIEIKGPGGETLAEWRVPEILSNPILMRQLVTYKVAGKQLSAGALAELQRIWERMGYPGINLDHFINTVAIQ